MATKVLQCPTFRTKNIFWCKSFWFIIQKTVKFQTNFFFPRTHFCWFSFHEKRRQFFLVKLKIKIWLVLLRRNYTVHADRASNLRPQINLFKFSNLNNPLMICTHVWTSYVRYFSKLKTKANVNPCRGRAAWRAATEPPRTQRRFWSSLAHRTFWRRVFSSHLFY